MKKKHLDTEALNTSGTVLLFYSVWREVLQNLMRENMEISRSHIYSLSDYRVSIYWNAPKYFSHAISNFIVVQFVDLQYREFYMDCLTFFVH